MNRLILTWIVALAGVALSQAQDEGRDRAGRRGQLEERRRMQPADGPRSRFENLAQQMADELQLDEKQREQLVAIAQEHEQYFRSRMAERQGARELVEQLRAARDSGDEKRVDELREQLRRRNEAGARENVMQAFLDDVEPILRDDQMEAFAAVRERLERGPAFDPAQRSRRMFARLKEQLELDDDQAQRFDQLVEQMAPQPREQRPSPDEIRSLVDALREARAAGDDAKADELEAQLRALRPDPRALLEPFFKALEPILRPDQKRTLAEFQAEWNGGGRGPAEGRGRALDARLLLRMVRRLDLSAEQVEQVKQIEKDTQTAQREVRGEGAGARTELNQQVKDQLKKVLTPEQWSEFEKMVERQESGGGRGERPRRGPGRPGTPPPAPEPAPEPEPE